ncbi:MAG: SpoIIE family protein phosphatase, partial [Acidimicrobiia bacterium]
NSLRAYVLEPGEAGLQEAYELGRRAVREQLSVLELSAIHHAILATLLRPPANGQQLATVADALTAFFNESLSAFEMVQRGFGEVQKIALLEKQYADQLRSLAEGSTALNSTFSSAEILWRLAELAPSLVDARLCLVIAAPAGDWSQAHVAAAHPQHEMNLPPGEWLARLYAKASSGEARVPAEPQMLGELMPGDLLVAVLAELGTGHGLVIVSGKRDGSFSERDVSLLRQLTQTCSVAIERSGLYERQRRIAETLQRGLLPNNLPNVPGLEFATRYLPGGAGENVGGDWFDVLNLGSHRIGLAIGDVVGRGVRAASEMGQVRTAFRAYALEHGDPGAVLGRMAELLRAQNPEHFSTVAYLVLEMDRMAIQVARAGHLPPLLMYPDGSAAYVNGGLSPPLGAAKDAIYKQVEVPVSSGCTIVLFTDGLIGRQHPDEGLARIRGALVGAAAVPGTVWDRVLGTMSEDSRDD